jgi:hypothetical protein
MRPSLWKEETEKETGKRRDIFLVEKTDEMR